MQLAVIGCNHKIAGVSLREKLAQAFSKHFSHCTPFHEGNFALLSTCNRSELYFSSDDLAQTHQEILQILNLHIDDTFFEQKLYTFFGLDCFVHLAKVCAGLDSAIVCETEIQGQVRLAYMQAHAQLNKELHFLFQKCLKISKECRTVFQEAKKLPNLEHALLHYAKGHFGSNVPAALFIGASEINLKIAKFFKQQGITKFSLCNRSEMSTSFIEKELDATFLPWEKLQTKWTEFEWIICATKCPDYVLTHDADRQTTTKLLVDLSVPRNIDPKLKNAKTQLLNIDDLEVLLDERRQALEEKMHVARDEITSKALRAIRYFHAKKEAKVLRLAMA